MRLVRILGDPGEVCHYHVISRIIEKRFVFGPKQREFFRKVLTAYCKMSGIELITWACLSNHFHLLVKVPPESEREKLSDQDILKRLGYVMSSKRLAEVEELLKLLKKDGSKKDYEAYRQVLLARMYSLPAFMREFKQRISRWYNGREERKGPVWEDRYKSVLVEGCGGKGNVLLLMAAYIDLNPVRAGLVKDPKDYRWSGYGEAVGGRQESRRGLLEIEERKRKIEDWGEFHRWYRKVLVGGMGKSNRGVGDSGFEDGEMGWRSVLATKVKYFTDGLVLGSASYVEEVFFREKGRMKVKRKVGARVPREKLLERWRVMKDLRGIIK